MDFRDMNSEQKLQMREFVTSAQTRFSTYRDSKETMAFAGLAIYLGACATALSTRDWPPPFAGGQPLSIVAAFTVFWLMVAIYLRYQLRVRRWATFRVAGCDWLLAEWLPDSPRAMEGEAKEPEKRPKPTWGVLLLDLAYPVERSVVAIDPKFKVYPDVIERSWVLATKRPADSLILERIIHAAGWIGWVSVSLRSLLA